MNKSEDYKYYENNLFQMVELPYKSNYVSFLVLLPKKKKGISNLENELVNDYNVDYYESTAPTNDAANNNIGSVSRERYGTKSLPEMRSGGSGQITFKDLTSALYICEGYMRRTHANLETLPQPLIQISFQISADFKDFISLETFFKLTLSDESWTNKIFEIFQFQINEDKNTIDIVAVEVVT